jgi:hypothetical protein
MRADDRDGLPMTGETGRYLGVRSGVDIPVGEDGHVEPATEGMSVVPPPVTNLAPHRLPREHGGRSNDTVFELETDELPEKLRYRPDPEAPERHGFIEPARRMPFDEYRQAIYGTRTMWRPVR